MTTSEWLDDTWTDAEIRCYYRQMSGKVADRVQILSELALKDQEEIKDIVGLPHVGGMKKTDWRIAAYELWKRGYNDTEISETLQIKRNTVAYWRRIQGVPGHFGRKLSDKSMDKFIMLYEAGVPNNEIAKALRISPSTVTKRVKAIKEKAAKR